MIKRLNNKSESLARVMKQVFYKSYEIERQLLGVADFPPLHRKLEQFMHTDTQFYGYWDGDILAAVIEIRIAADSLHIQSLVVSPGFFRRGIASQLIQYVFDIYPLNEYTVETGAANSPAILLYQKFGFRIQSEYIAQMSVKKVKMIKTCDQE